MATAESANPSRNQTETKSEGLTGASVGGITTRPQKRRLAVRSADKRELPRTKELRLDLRNAARFADDLAERHGVTISRSFMRTGGRRTKPAGFLLKPDRIKHLWNV
jgi:hypothetical protein